MHDGHTKWFRTFLLSSVVILVGATSVWLISDKEVDQNIRAAVTYEEIVEFYAEELEETKHTPVPDEVRAIYWTAYTAGAKRGDQLLEYMLDYGLNSVVIDMKMDNGALAYESKNELLHQFMMRNPAIDDFEAVLDKLYENDIYRIARITVMKDNVFARNNPELALKYSGGSLWQDSIGSLWLDPAAEGVSGYALALAREAYELGFDEVQFDYVRFPSDGYLSSIRYPVYDRTKETKVEVMQRFFKAVGEPLRDEGIPVSFDVFGMTYETSSDFNIGQRIVDIYDYADYISPMVYPSHYAYGFQGFGNPALYPYEIVMHSLEKGKEIMETERGILPEEFAPVTRPWLQDFDIGAVYTASRIEAQIKAARDAGASGWMLWNARNVYQPANYLPKEVVIE